MHLLGLFLLLSAQADAARCSAAATARVDAAEDLLAQAYDAAPIDKAAILERSLILLERTLDDEPACKAAQKLKAHADTLHDDFEALSTAAALEQAIRDAEARVADAEDRGLADPEDLQTLRFHLKALSQLLPGDDRVDGLMTRAAALQVQP
jgi:hypothetical protein